MSETGDVDLESLLTVNLEGPLPSRLADLWSIGSDLAFVAACCDELLLDPPTGDEGEASVIRRALYEAAVISYARCFGRGKGHVDGLTRYRLPTSAIDAAGPEARATHDFTLNARDKHIGHRVGDHEQVRVTAHLTRPPAERAAVGMQTLGIHLVEPMPPALESLRELAWGLHVAVQNEMRRLTDRALEIADDTLDKLYSDALAADDGA